MKKIIFFFFFFQIQFIYCQIDGVLDISFGVNGKVITDFGGNDGIHGVAIQEDGKIVVSGTVGTYPSYDFGLARYKTNGDLDSTFGYLGKVVTEFGSNAICYALLIQDDGKIIVSGFLDSIQKLYLIVRYNNDGSIDTTFNHNGIVTTNMNGTDGGFNIAIQPDNKIITVGRAFNGVNNDIGIVRYKPNGTIDSLFGLNGKVITDMGGQDIGWSILVQPDYKLLIAGTTNFNGTDDFALLRYNIDGSLDNTFGLNGKVITDFGGFETGMEIANSFDGNIFVAGSSNTLGNSDFALISYNSNGQIDSTFGLNGKVTTDFGGNDYCYALAVRQNGKIILGGYTTNSNTDFALACYDINGVLDNSFGLNGKVIADFGDIDYGQALAIQQDDKIVLAGASGNYPSFNFSLARFGKDVTKVNDNVYSENNILIYPNPTKNIITIETSIIKDSNPGIILIYNLQGKILKQQLMQSENTKICISEFSQGIYFLKLCYANKIEIIKIIKE